MATTKAQRNAAYKAVIDFEGELHAVIRKLDQAGFTEAGNTLEECLKAIENTHTTIKIQVEREGR